MHKCLINANSDTDERPTVGCLSMYTSIDQVLPPFTDAISKYTGMVAIVAIIGPVGATGGKMLVRRFGALLLVRGN